MEDDIRNPTWKRHFLGGMAAVFQEGNTQSTFVACCYNETMGFVYSLKRFDQNIDSPLAPAGNKRVQLDTRSGAFRPRFLPGPTARRRRALRFGACGDARAQQRRTRGHNAPMDELSGAMHTMLGEQNMMLCAVKLSGLHQTESNFGVPVKAGRPELGVAIGKATSRRGVDLRRHAPCAFAG